MCAHFQGLGNSKATSLKVQERVPSNCQLARQKEPYDSLTVCLFRKKCRDRQYLCPKLQRHLTFVTDYNKHQNKKKRKKNKTILVVRKLQSIFPFPSYQSMCIASSTNNMVIKYNVKHNASYI